MMQYDSTIMTLDLKGRVGNGILNCTKRNLD